MPLPLIAAAGIAAGANLLSQGVGGLFSRKARKKAQRQRRQQMREDAAMYGRMAGEDALQRSAAQRSINYMRDQIRDNANRRRGTQAVMGATNAASAAGAQADSNALAHTMSAIAANADDRRDRLRMRQQAARDQYTQQQAADAERRSQEIGSATAAAGSAIGSLAAQYLASPDNSSNSGHSPSSDNWLKDVYAGANTTPPSYT